MSRLPPAAPASCSASQTVGLQPSCNCQAAALKNVLNLHFTRQQASAQDAAQLGHAKAECTGAVYSGADVLWGGVQGNTRCYVK